MLKVKQWIQPPKRSDYRPLSQFYHANETLNKIIAELGTFDGKQNVDRCAALVNKLREQHQIVYQKMMAVVEHAVPSHQRHPRHYRLKFPEDFLKDNLGGIIWFGIEGISAGSTIHNHEAESQAMKPLATKLRKQLDTTRDLLKRQSLRNANAYPITLKDELIQLDKFWCDFELQYISLLTELKSPTSVEDNQLLAVIFSEAINRALISKLLDISEIESFEPTVFFAIPRLAILYCVATTSDQHLRTDFNTHVAVPLMLNSFRQDLCEVKELLQSMNEEEFSQLEIELSSGHSNKNKAIPAASTIDNRSEICTSSYSGQEVSHVVSVSCHGATTEALEAENRLLHVQEAKNMIHMLFVKISSIADRLHHLHAEDIRIALQMSIKIHLNNPSIFNDHLAVDSTPAEEITEIPAAVEIITNNIGNRDAAANNNIDVPMDNTQQSSEQDLNSHSSEQEMTQNAIIRAPSWISSANCNSCASCEATFTILRRKHHCGSCGKVICKSCTSRTKNSPYFGFYRSVRVCQECFKSERLAIDSCPRPP